MIHNHLIRFPDIGFFVSPIPLHIAAMVILCGHLSQLHRLQPHVEVQDIWMALDVLPRMRWRWERKDVNGEHPMIAQLAERILSINLRDVVPTGDHMLLSEQDWDSEISLLSPSIAVQKQEQVTPVMRNVPFPIHGGNESYGTPSRDSHSNGPMTRLKPDLTDGRREMAIPSDLFYPFYPERSVQNGPQDFQELLAAAGAQGGPYSSESYLPNSGPNVNHSRMPGWTQVCLLFTRHFLPDICPHREECHTQLTRNNFACYHYALSCLSNAVLIPNAIDDSYFFISITSDLGLFMFSACLSGELFLDTTQYVLVLVVNSCKIKLAWRVCQSMILSSRSNQDDVVQ